MLLLGPWRKVCVAANSTTMDSFDDSDSSEFFSPISISFFQPSNKAKATPERLPPLHDTSWIGARLSPIRSFDNDHEDDDSLEQIATALKYNDHMPVNEKTVLLRPMQGGVTFHPRYTEPPPSTTKSLCWTPKIPHPFGAGRLVCALSGAFLIAQITESLWRIEQPADMEDLSYMALLVMYLHNLSTWFWQPAMGDDYVWTHFALSTSTPHASYWCMATSLFMATTIGEWLLVYMAWTILGCNHRLLSNRQLIFLFVTSAFTGQLWMLAWEPNPAVLTGCLSWGTCGVLCGAGIVQPYKRFLYFMVAIGLTANACLQRPYNSVLGTLGGSYFGWALAAAGLVAPEHVTIPIRTVELTHEQQLHQWRCATAAIFMWVLPVLWIAFSAEV